MSDHIESLGKEVIYKRQRDLRAAQCDALRASLRRLLPPEALVEELDGEAILTTALSLQQTLAELKDADRRLDAVKNTHRL